MASYFLRFQVLVLGIILAFAQLSQVAAQDSSKKVPVEMAGYAPACGVDIKQENDRLTVSWPMDGEEWGRLVLDLGPGRPLFASLGTAKSSKGIFEEILSGLEPVTFLTVGTRKAPAGRPPEFTIWNTFFDKPASRPFQSYRSQRDLQKARVTSAVSRAQVILERMIVGPFSGELVLTFYAGSRLLHVEAVVATEQDGRAILYDAGLIGQETSGWSSLAWRDTAGKMQRAAADLTVKDRPLAVRHRILAAEGRGGSLACFSPPHQYHFPRDWTDNLKFVWFGRDHLGLGTEFGLGIRQVPNGGRAFEPWCNAPPHTRQRLGVFYLLSGGKAETAFQQTLRYTHEDRFLPLPGHVTYTHHYHMAVAVTAMNQKKQIIPDFVEVFKDLGVQVLHLAEFHGDGHPRDPGPLRLPELEMLFRECSRLSDDQFLLLPGEEINDFLGIREKGKHPGHWMTLFPRPVYWTMQRGPDQPLVENHPRYGKIYHVGSRADMMELLRREKGLAWTAHPRIKASSWTPDIFRNEDFYLADFWIGAAWKHMPADLSHDRLGQRALAVLDDMANWGQKKYLLGEVDVFKIDRTHELYGHMNVNYVRLAKLPRYEQSWQPLLDALQAGKFFVTTGEILMQEFQVSGKESGETLSLLPGQAPEIRLTLSWTFPLRFAEIISGDGAKIYRQRLDLADTGPFGQRTWTLQPDLRNRKWVRVEVWDVAVNGAFSQPVWLQESK